MVGSPPSSPTWPRCPLGELLVVDLERVRDWSNDTMMPLRPVTYEASLAVPPVLNLGAAYEFVDPVSITPAGRRRPVRSSNSAGRWAAFGTHACASPFLPAAAACPVVP